MSALTVSKDEEKRLKGQGFLNNRGTDEFSARVITVNGKVTAAQHRCMAEAAEKFGNGNLTYTTRLSVEIQGIPYEKIEEFQEFIAKEDLETGGTGAKVRPVVSCKGTTCQYGLLDSFAISEEIHNSYIGKTLRCLVDGKDKDLLTARTEGGRLVRFPGCDDMIGTYQDITITAATTWSLSGKAADIC